MILRISARHSFERCFVIEAIEARGNRANHFLESARILGDCFAEFVELGPRRHPETGAEQRSSARLEVEIVAGASSICFCADTARGVPMMKPGCRVRLVRRFVLREADVAIDAEHRSPGIAA